MPVSQMKFWLSKSLSEMSHDEWESLCDGCGKCCLHKLEDEDTGEIFYTSVACRLLDIKTCRCKDYPMRMDRVPDCLDVKHIEESRLGWLPSTCAYRLLAEGKDLPSWHPLISGKPNSVREAGVSVAGFALPEGQARDLQDYVIGWIK